MSQQVNPKRTKVAINNNAGAWTVIRLTTWAKYVAIYEDLTQNAGATQGLQYNLLDPFALSGNITQNAEPAPPDYFVSDKNASPEIEVGDARYIHSPTTMPLGNPGSGGNVDNPGGVATLGTPVLQLRTNSANPTNAIVEEWV